MRDYWLDPPEHANPICPVCGEECETIYKDTNGVVGCENCISSQDAYDWAEEMERDEEAAYGDHLYEMRREEMFERRHGNG